MCLYICLREAIVTLVAGVLAVGLTVLIKPLKHCGHAAVKAPRTSFIRVWLLPLSVAAPSLHIFIMELIVANRAFSSVCLYPLTACMDSSPNKTLHFIKMAVKF